MTDLSNGLDPQREGTLHTAPGPFRYAENFMMALCDPVSGIGLWLHLGTCPDDFTLWEDQVLLTLPGDEGVMWMTSYGRPAPAQRPAGPVLSFRCIEPFQRWTVEFDGMLVHSSNTEMLSGRLRDGVKQRVSFSLDTRALVPAWDNHLTAASGDKATRGSMAGQSWASEHYQQLYQVEGTLQLGTETYTINTTGVRDHSRGQRGHASHQWGGHNLWTAVFPSGKAFGMQRMWSPQKQLNLNVGFVYLHGEFHFADVISAPDFLEQQTTGGDALQLVLRSPLGEHRITGVTTHTFWANLERPYGLSMGSDPQAGFGTFAPGFAHWEWDGEAAIGFAERSGP
jgi:hypothetical protein